MQIKRIAAPVAALAVLGAVVASAPSAAATTPASGSLVVTASNSYLQSELQQGIGQLVASPATASWSYTAGATTTFPVSGGDLSLTGYSGSAQFGGGLVLIDARTGRTATFGQLSFDAISGVVSGVPQGGTAPVALLDPTGDINVSVNAGVQTLTASEVDLDPAAASYLNTALCTTFFAGGSAIGTLTVNFTPAS